MSSVHAFVALGSNLGDRAAMIAFALKELAASPGIRILDATEPIETAPLGGLAQPPYLNAMALLAVALSPEELLRHCQRIERAAGRVMREPWASRELDLDIVRFGEVEMDTPRLRLPHPGLADRDFWQDQIAQLVVVHHG